MALARAGRSGPGKARSASASRRFSCRTISAPSRTKPATTAIANANRAGQVGDLLSQVVGDQAIRPDPGHGTGHVRDHEAPPRHVVGAGEEGGIAAQDRNETGEEYDVAAITQEQILPDLDPRRG